MPVDFSGKFEVDIKVGESEDWPGLMEVKILLSWREVYVWVGKDLAIGVAGAVESMECMREVFNRERDKKDAEEKASRIADARTPVLGVENESLGNSQRTDPELEHPPLNPGMEPV